MHILTEQLATEIVKRTMSILEANINIMDQTGTIIASGDVSRIGQLHDGARRVIDQKTTIEIDVAQADQSTGSHPGINLPIHFQENIVGVIGITGEPDHIRDYSRLIQMGAELTLEQAFLTNEIQRNKQIRHNLFANIFLGSYSNQDYILERTRYVNINTDETFGIILISPHFTNNEKLKYVENQLKSCLSDGDEYFQLFTNKYIILKKQLSPNLTTRKQLKYFIEQKEKTSPLSNVTIGIGSFSKGIQGWRKSYQEAKDVIDVASTLRPDGGIWDHNDFELAILCNHFLRNSREEANKLIDKYKRLLVEKDVTHLHETLQMYINENGKTAKTAKSLFIHRNTLSYRLDKIYNLTGKNPKNLKGLFELKIAQLLYYLSEGD